MAMVSLLSAADGTSTESHQSSSKTFSGSTPVSTNQLCISRCGQRATFIEDGLSGTM